jgi:hypothetical protein
MGNLLDMECARVICECPYLLAFGRGGQRPRPNIGNAPFFCDADGENWGDLVQEIAMGWPDRWFQAPLKWMAITRMVFTNFAFR